MKRIARYKRMLRRKSNQKRIVLGFFILIFGTVGAYALFRSFAATPAFGIDPENGLLTGAIGTNTNANASGGMFVRFDDPGGGNNGGGDGDTNTFTYRSASVQDALGFVTNSGISTPETWLGRSVKYQVKYAGGRKATKSKALQDFTSGIKNNGNRTVIMTLNLAFDPDRGCTGMSDQFKTTLMQGVVNGNDDDHWKAIAKAVKDNNMSGYFADGRPKLVMRLGWESNGNWFCWATTGRLDPNKGKSYNADLFKSAYRRVHDLVNTEAGADLVWSYGINSGGSGGPVSNAITAYPGDAYVDIVETDVYDNSEAYWNKNLCANGVCPDWTSETPWNQARNEKLNSMNQVVNASVWSSKPLAVGEWGVWTSTEGSNDTIVAPGGGDNTRWIQAMYDWQSNLVQSGRFVYGAYFDIDNNVGTAEKPKRDRSRLSGNSSSTNSTWHPKAAAKFKSLFK